MLVCVHVCAYMHACTVGDFTYNLLFGGRCIVHACVCVHVCMLYRPLLLLFCHSLQLNLQTYRTMWEVNWLVCVSSSYSWSHIYYLRRDTRRSPIVAQATGETAVFTGQTGE